MNFKHFVCKRLRKTSFYLVSLQRRGAQQLRESLDKEVFAPHHALVYTQSSAFMVAAMFENPFPTRRFNREKLGCEKRRQNRSRIETVSLAASDILR